MNSASTNILIIISLHINDFISVEGWIVNALSKIICIPNFRIVIRLLSKISQPLAVYNIYFIPSQVLNISVFFKYISAY